MINNQAKILVSSNSKKLLFGLFFILFSLLLALGAYYTHIGILRYLSFVVLINALFLLFWSMKDDLEQSYHSYWIAYLVPLALVLLYLSLRTTLHHFDFSIGDASDYFLAGVCSVTYNQDIGFFLPLTASVSAVGYSIFGLEFAPTINILLLLTTIALFYHIFRKFDLSAFISILVLILYILLPLNIWFASTSFSDPIWQLFLLVFLILAYYIMQKESVSILLLITLYMLLFLAPFLRGESVLYFGILVPLILYHYWKYQKLSSILYLSFGLMILALSIHLTLSIRSGYLLNMQFNRVIPHITSTILMSIVYGTAVFGFIVIALMHVFKRFFIKINLAISITLFTLVFKIILAYYYAQKKSLPFENLLFLNEYGFALGNFGLPLTLLIIFGIFILYIKAMRGNVLAVITILIYSIFYIPFVMQKVTFYDPHAFLFYWNRYYLSMILIIHFIALSFSIQLIVNYLKKIFLSNRYIAPTVAFFFILLSIFSINLNLYPIVTQESHQTNAHKLAPWLKGHINNSSLSVVYESNAIYKQNKGHIGRYDIKHLISRMFTVFKIYAKSYQRLDPRYFDTKIKKDMFLKDYLLCVSKKPCMLKDQRLTPVDTLELSLIWREHFSLHFSSKDELSKSYINQWELHFNLYKVNPKEL